MKKFIQNSIFGIKPSFYFRQVFIICALFVLPVAVLVSSTGEVSKVIGAIASLVPMVLLFPYARVGIKCIIEYIQGGNVLIYNVLWKLVSVVLSAMFFFVLAPIGLIYLYRVNTRPM